MIPFLWSILTYVLLIGGFLLGIVLIAHILLQKRPPSGTIAWLLIIFFLPVGGGAVVFVLRRSKSPSPRCQERAGCLWKPTTPCPSPKPVHWTGSSASYDLPGAEAGHTIHTASDRRAALCGDV